MKAFTGILVGLLVAGVLAGAGYGAAKPMSRASVVAALEAKLKATETARAAKLPSRPTVACNSMSASAGSDPIVQCWASPASGKIVDAVSGVVRCGTRTTPCLAPAFCVFSVSVLAPPPTVTGTLAVNICAKR